MKTTFYVSAAAAILGLTSGVSAEASCERFDSFKGSAWHIEATGMPDIPGYCGGFWDNMNNRDWGGACVLSNTHCSDEGDGNMLLRFTSGSRCTPEYVHSGWFEATKHVYGQISC